MITQGIVKKILAYNPSYVKNELRWCYKNWPKVYRYYGRSLKNVLGSLPRPHLEEIYCDLVKTYGKKS